MIDLDVPAAATVPPRHRRGVLPRVAVLAACVVTAAVPAAAPVPVSVGQRLPVPSYCTGDPLPGGRLNIVEDHVYILLDGQTGVVLSTGRCPR
ncbi:hypothetical protein GCM10009827_045630 [Dactylosporangium maewongense]|uniref:Uncharacterized protein n=1 Tax=Dactylosporangium maewongense TaxID=634393 RepID=A0ABP4LHD7_9ACTN